MAAGQFGLRTLLIGALVCTATLAAAEDEQAKTPPSQGTDKAESGTVTARQPSRFRLAGVSIGAGYSYTSGYRPFWYSPYYWGVPYYSLWDFYSPFYYPFHPGYFNGFARGPNMGEVKLHAASKKAEVFVDGAYAGVAEDLKTLWLEPGAYNLEVRAHTGTPFSRRIYVLSGKTLKIDAAPGVKQ